MSHSNNVDLQIKSKQHSSKKQSSAQMADLAANLFYDETESPSKMASNFDFDSRRLNTKTEVGDSSINMLTNEQMKQGAI